VSVQVFVGPSSTGKTFFMREWLLPALLTAPEDATLVRPADGFKAVLIDDPPTAEKPEGQYEGPRYFDVAEWRRADKRSRVARFEAASARALFAAGVELGGLVLLFDDMERALGNVPAGGVASPPAEGVELLTRGRHHGCLVVGAVRRWGSLHNLVRGNVERAYFGALTDEGDRKAAAAVVGIPAITLEGLMRAAATEGGRRAKPLPGVFLEWEPKAGSSALVRIENRRKITIRRL
jgi:hypothetical protein